MNRIRSTPLRYGLALVSFALVLLVTLLVGRFSPFRIDLTGLIIVAMIGAAWYLGLGPGLMFAVLFEGTLDYFSRPALTARALIIVFNRLVLFASVVWFASSRRRAEQRLVRQRELLQVTLSSIGDAVIATDIEGRIQFMNPVAAAMTGWTNAEAAHQPLGRVFQIVNEDTQQPVESPFELIKQNASVVGLGNHTTLIAKSGTEIPIEDSGAPIKDADGTVIGTIIVFHDVSERRRSERDREQLLARERLARVAAEQADRLKDDFLATVSHELRTPLTSILGWASVLRQGPATDETMKKGLAVIERNAKAQAELVGDILDVSSIISGKLRTKPQTIAIAPIISAAIDTLRVAADAKKIRISLALPAKPVLVIGDADRLQQIFWNLMSNAVKFTPEGGEVDVEVGIAGGQVQVSVSDNGVGIASEFMPHLFERFRQADSSTTRSYGGLGLGLSIARHLVELHGGQVSAESKGPGQGATFTIQLPAAEMDDPDHDAQRAIAKPEGWHATEELSVPGAGIAGVRVLLVDDEEDTLEVLSFMLRGNGADVRTASSSEDAIEILGSWKPDVLISDLSMPREDGFTLISKVRNLQSEEGGDIPAAALTAHVRDEDRDSALAAGYQAHIPKPVDAVALRNTIATLVRSTPENVAVE